MKTKWRWYDQVITHSQSLTYIVKHSSDFIISPSSESWFVMGCVILLKTTNVNAVHQQFLSLFRPSSVPLPSLFCTRKFKSQHYWIVAPTSVESCLFCCRTSSVLGLCSSMCAETRYGNCFVTYYSRRCRSRWEVVDCQREWDCNTWNKQANGYVHYKLTLRMS